MVVMTSSHKESLVQYEGDPYSSDSSDDQDCPGGQGHLKEGIFFKRKDDISDQPTVVWKETLFSFLASLPTISKFHKNSQVCAQAGKRV